MSTPFSSSLRSLTADRGRRSLGGILLATALLSAWAVWFFLARVTLYAVTTLARLEVDRAVYPIAAPVTGQIVGTRLSLGHEVQTGEVLVELETNEQRLQIEEERGRLAALQAQRDGLTKEIRAEEEGQRRERQTARVALAEARARYREAQMAAQAAQKEADIYRRMQAYRLASELEFLRVTTEASKRQAAAQALRLAISRLESEQQTKESERQGALERLQREASQLTGQIAAATATLERLAYEMTRRSIRAPMAGCLCEVANVRIGMVVREGDRLGAIVSPGTLKVIADFLPATALGRIKPGQPARLRLEGFPWTQYGAVAARVTSVASEIRDNVVRAELTVDAAASPIPLQHGLPGSVEVAVERLAPATLMLRTAGLLLAAPDTAPERRDGTRAER
jgi:membrane fusion protein (multidrug efflux system)